MKYSALFGLAALALGFTACDDIDEGTGIPQSNPQLEIVKADNASVAAGAAAASLIDLETLNNSSSVIEIASVTKASDWPDGFTASVPYMQISNEEGFGKYETVEASEGADGTVIIDPDNWETAHKALFGKSPYKTVTYVRFPIVAVNGDQKVRMGGENYYYGNFSVEVKPFDLFDGQIIEESYYLINSVDNWSFDKAVEFGHSLLGVYDDPTFSVIANVNGAGYQWAVIPATTFAAGSLEAAYGVEDPNELNGTLVKFDKGETITYGLIDEVGPHMIKVNMLDLTYETSLAIPQLYTPGDSNSWNQGASQILTTDNYVDYSGYAHLSGGFKFSSQANWDGINYGNAGNGMLSTDGGAGNLEVANDALYWCTVNLAALTYSTTEISTIGIIGSATPNGWDASTALTPSADFLIWTATIKMTDGAFKFRANDDWDINLGGALDNLTSGGSDLNWTGEGTYLVTLDLSSVPYKATFTKQ